MKDIAFQLAGRSLNAKLGSRIEKKALYGYPRRVAEKDGVILSRGYLAPDGSLLQRSEISSVRVDPEGTPADDIQVEIDGHPAEMQPSAFDQANPLTPAPLTDLVGFGVTDVYPVDDLDLEAGLYRTEFTYRKAYFPKEALLLKKNNGESYLLVGARKLPTFVGLNVTYSFFDTDESPDSEESEELDFSMV